MNLRVDFTIFLYKGQSIFIEHLQLDLIKYGKWIPIFLFLSKIKNFSTCNDLVSVQQILVSNEFLLKDYSLNIITFLSLSS